VIRVHVTQNSDTHLNLVVDKLVAYRRSLVLHTDVIDDQTQRLASVESRVYALEKLTGTQLLWKIDKYSERLQAAKTGTTPTVYSPPFVSNKHGYKLMMSANLNGGGKGQSICMSYPSSACARRRHRCQFVVWFYRLFRVLHDNCRDYIFRFLFGKQFPLRAFVT